MTTPLVECVPNFSEGQNPKVIQQIADAIRSVPDVSLLHIDSGKAAHRTVFTFAGTPEAVIEAAFRAIQTASEHIDMRQHFGEHPRMGATDVCPLIPLANISMEEVIALAERLAERVGRALQIPVYLYEMSARHPERRNLAYLRAGEYEGLAEKMKLADWKPDFGPTAFNAKSGAVVIGARNFLIAYNVNLNTESVAIAKRIAAEVRESGRIEKNEQSEKVRIPGKCKAVKAIGWYIEEYGKAQVSMNLINFQVTPIHEVFEACQESAAKYGTAVTGSELIGMTPLQVLRVAGVYFLQKANQLIPSSERTILGVAVRELGLDELQPFSLDEKIIEYKMQEF